MLGSRYNDKKERLENCRQSFFLRDSNAIGAVRTRSTGSSATTALQAVTATASVTGVRRHSIAQSRSLDSGICMTMGVSPFHANNPQDDYGSTSNTNTDKEAPLLTTGGRSKSMVQLQQSSCTDLTNLDEKPILDVVDRIEDKVEAHAYQDLVPLEVKLALENRVFGWSHLTSIILGHTLYTVASFLLAFFTVTQLHHLYYAQFHHPADPYDERTSPNYDTADDMWFRSIRLAIAAFCAISTFRIIRRRRHVWFRNAYGSKAYQKDAARRRVTVRETDQTTLLGRLMRRGNEMMQRRVQKKLFKAQKFYQKRYQRHQQRIKEEQEKLLQQQQHQQLHRTTNPQKAEDSNLVETTEQDHLCSPRSMCSFSPCDSFCGGDYNVVDEPSQAENSDSTPTSSDEEDFQAFLNSPISSSLSEELNPESNHRLQTRSRQKRRRTFHTDPPTQLESIMHDQILFRAGRILRMPYAHGGFFGAAPFMLANPRWISILRHLMPDVYVEISRRVAYAPASRLIHWAENNPVVAAYGVAHDLEFGMDAPALGGVDGGDQNMRTTPNLEWDVFLDPYLVADVEIVLSERDRFLSSILPMEHYSFYETHKPLGLSLEDWQDSINAAAMASGYVGAKIEFTESQRQILKYYADQLEGRAQVLVDKMLIAHGKLTHLIFEALGLAKRYNYSRVKRTRKALGGGIYAQQWMAVYAEALKFGLYNDRETLTSLSDSVTSDDVVSSIKNVDSFMSTSLDALASAKCPDSSIAESVSTIQSILRRHGDDNLDIEFPVGIVLDIKSRHISKRVWACVVDTLRASGVRVVGLASFTVDEIRGISKFCSEPLMEVIFFHSAGDLQRACHDGKIRYGDKVFFNCGSLIWCGTQGLWSATGLACSMGFDPESVKRCYSVLPFGRTRKMHDAERMNSSSSSRTWMDGSSVELYKERYGLSIGMYAQEFAIDDTAANLIVELVNDNPEVYDLGLSWGGCNGVSVRGIQPGRFTSTDGLWNQRYTGALWDSNLYPPPTSASPTGTPPQTPTLQEKQQ